MKNSPANAGDTSLIPGLGRFPGGGSGNLLQDSCLENPMDKRAWRVTVHRVAKSWTPLEETVVVTHLKQRRGIVQSNFSREVFKC